MTVIHSGHLTAARPPRCNLKHYDCDYKVVRSPNSGTASEVGGMISARRRKNTVRESSMEMHRVTLWWNLK